MAALASLFLFAHSGAARATDPDPGQANRALNALFAASNEIIPPTSSCQGHYVKRGQPRIRDLLSSHFAYFRRGESVVTGQCDGARSPHCSVSINGAFGDSASFTTISFTLHDERLSIASLSCVITP